MSDLAIRVEGLGKEYRIGRQRESYRTLRDSISQGVQHMLARARAHLAGAGAPPSADPRFWALRDVSFQVPRGELLGIIGSNGAGKSTLLKILSRVTEPTTGRAEIRGRVGSLLEVGTGFHSELSGRENIFLNGAILGMRRAEILRKFDQIVDFAEMGRFIDTPVKHYSSGMYLRLAFAVAAHLESDILLVDEVLAVGDAAFQRRCLGKMDEVAREQRTVLFVSHNMAALANLCRTAFRIDGGRIVDQGPVDVVVRNYLLDGRVSHSQDLATHPGRPHGSRPLIRRVALLDGDLETAVFRSDGGFAFEVECAVGTKELGAVSLGFLISDSRGLSVCAGSMDQYESLAPNYTGRMRIRGAIDLLCLAPGLYTLSLYLGNGLVDLDEIEHAIAFEVVWEGRADIPQPPRPAWGPLVLPVRWEWEARGAD